MPLFANNLAYLRLLSLEKILCFGERKYLPVSKGTNGANFTYVSNLQHFCCNLENVSDNR